MDVPPDRTDIAGRICDANPMGTDGFEFVEFTGPDLPALEALFTRLGFAAVAQHRSKDVTLWRQGETNFILNAEPESFAQAFQRVHGPCACAMAFRVKDAKAAHERALKLGATDVKVGKGDGELDIPAIEGIGGSRLFFVDRYGATGSIYDVDFDFHPDWRQRMAQADSKLTYIDHLTHNVNRGQMATWAGFYERLFNFREIRYFDIEGKLTGLKSRAMTSPDGAIRIPINESSDDKSQIEEYLHAYHGEGIQHIALATENIYASVETLAAQGAQFQDTPDTYYERLDNRIKGHGEDAARLKRDRILMDGEKGDLLLQIFTQNAIGPIFFEIIQRKGNQGFGEGNFKALFESIEADQIKRGVLKDTSAA